MMSHPGAMQPPGRAPQMGSMGGLASPGGPMGSYASPSPLEGTFGFPGSGSPYVQSSPPMMGSCAGVGPMEGTFGCPSGQFAKSSPPMMGSCAGVGPMGSLGGSCGGPGPMGSPSSPGPMGSFTGPPTGCPPPVAGPFATWPAAPNPYGQQYEVAQQQVRDRLQAALQKNAELENTIEQETNGLYEEHLKRKFSQMRKAHLDGIDWRVPRLQYCKDPQYNSNLEPALAFEVQERKAADSQVLEFELSKEANVKWGQALVPVGMAPPPLEKTIKPGVAFTEASPNYVRADDVWGRKLDLRTLEEAMRGDVSKPMPRPVLFSEDYANYHEGKYVKDDCPIS